MQIPVNIYILNLHFKFILQIITENLSLKCKTFDSKRRNTQWRTQEFFRGGVQQIQLRTEDKRERGSEGGSPLGRGSGGSCNFVQEI
jgi:hypothetical protein